MEAEEEEEQEAQEQEQEEPKHEQEPTHGMRRALRILQALAAADEAPGASSGATQPSAHCHRTYRVKMLSRQCVEALMCQGV